MPRPRSTPGDGHPVDPTPPDRAETEPSAAPANTIRPAASPTWTPRSVAIFTLLLATLFAGARLLAHDGDPTAFVSAGDKVTDPILAPDLAIKVDNTGYDGQYFHRLARNPFTDQQREFGTILDRPAYRHQRIGYPLVTWALSGGGTAALVPWMLVGVNLASMAALGYVAARMAVDAGRPAWWGFIPALWPGLIVALSYDLSEAMALALLATALLMIRRQHWYAGAAALTAAGLTRETTLVVAAAVVGAAVLGRLPLRGWLGSFGAPRGGVQALVGLVPLAVAGAYRIVLEQRWEGVPRTGADTPSFIGIPFVELVSQVFEWITSASPVDLYLLFQVVVLVVVVVALARSLAEPGAGLPHERLALVGFLLIMSMLPTWDRSVVFLRWADEAVLLGWAMTLGASRIDVRPVMKAVAALALTTAMVWISI